MRTLSIAGIDGTIKRRFRGTVAAKRAWMKTGTLKHAKNIAGYVRSKRGELYEVVILVNSKKPRYLAAKMQDEIIISLIKYAFQTKKSEHIKKVQSKKGVFIQTGVFERCPPPDYYLPGERMRVRMKCLRFGNVFKVVAGPYRDHKEAERYLPSIRRSYRGAFILM
jgi:D-alanyl-D-alanine carboxypeptidase/D-alanyl-D-alanine-endopeptidase (penicillin-binding protein 4)